MSRSVILPEIVIERTEKRAENGEIYRGTQLLAADAISALEQKYPGFYVPDANEVIESPPDMTWWYDEPHGVGVIQFLRRKIQETLG